jgi:hypothetical protein
MSNYYAWGRRKGDTEWETVMVEDLGEYYKVSFPNGNICFEWDVEIKHLVVNDPTEQLDRIVEKLDIKGWGIDPKGPMKNSFKKINKNNMQFSQQQPLIDRFEERFGRNAIHNDMIDDVHAFLFNRYLKDCLTVLPTEGEVYDVEYLAGFHDAINMIKTNIYGKKTKMD